MKFNANIVCTYIIYRLILLTYRVFITNDIMLFKNFKDQKKLDIRKTNNPFNSKMCAKLRYFLCLCI